VAIAAFILLLLVREVPLRTTIDTAEVVTEAVGIEEASVAEAQRADHQLVAAASTDK
jgi:hypothetical protein